MVGSHAPRLRDDILAMSNLIANGNSDRSDNQTQNSRITAPAPRLEKKNDLADGRSTAVTQPSMGSMKAKWETRHCARHSANTSLKKG